MASECTSLLQASGLCSKTHPSEMGIIQVFCFLDLHANRFTAMICLVRKYYLECMIRRDECTIAEQIFWINCLHLKSPTDGKIKTEHCFTISFLQRKLLINISETWLKLRLHCFYKTKYSVAPFSLILVTCI